MLRFVLFFVVVSTIQINADDPIIEPIKCLHPNESYQTCASCETTCANLYLNPVCDKRCRIGCFCNEGFVRNSTGSCVYGFDCASSEIKCPINQQVDECINPCFESTCSGLFYKPEPIRFCALFCRRGCACKPGYVIDDINGRGCIPINKCPPKINCAAHQEFTNCGPSTPLTCDNRNNSVSTEKCVAGCFCIKGYVEDRNSNCIPENQCPLDCKVNEIQSSCPSPCQPTCEEPHPYVCPFLLCNPGCICEPPYVKDLKGECVDRNTCESECKDINAVYTHCGGSGCVRTCKNYKEEIICQRKCTPGCSCKDGYVLDENRGKCVPIEFCNCE